MVKTQWKIAQVHVNEVKTLKHEKSQNIDIQFLYPIGTFSQKQSNFESADCYEGRKTWWKIQVSKCSGTLKKCSSEKITVFLKFLRMRVIEKSYELKL